LEYFINDMLLFLKAPDKANVSGPHRVMAQALMKRAIGDIPIVTHIQKESAGMNKLYSQSMCSVKQWRAFQAAEAMVSGEVDEVRAEADEIEPGWSQVRGRCARRS
jgi:Preprotein translocase subunit Sec66